MKIDTRECEVEELPPEVTKLVRQLLSAAEKLLLCVLTREEPTLADVAILETPGLHRLSLTIVTDARLLVTRYYQYSMLGITRNFVKPLGDRAYSTTSVFLAEVSGMREVPGVAHVAPFRVVVTTPGHEEITCPFASQQASLKFKGVLTSTIAGAKARTTQSPRSTVERLKELERLHKDGIVTDKEYTAKRKRLLNQL